MRSAEPSAYEKKIAALHTQLAEAAKELSGIFGSRDRAVTEEHLARKRLADLEAHERQIISVVHELEARKASLDSNCADKDQQLIQATQRYAEMVTQSVRLSDELSCLTGAVTNHATQLAVLTASVQKKQADLTALNRHIVEIQHCRDELRDQALTESMKLQERESIVKKREEEADVKEQKLNQRDIIMQGYQQQLEIAATALNHA